jgi:putative phosphoribosyl transferase
MESHLPLFQNRADAGRKLASALASYSGLPQHLVIGLPRGGVIVAKEVALALHLPLDFISVRKIGAPQFPELALGAIAGDVVYWNEPLIASVGVSKVELQQIIEREKQEMARRKRLYRGERKSHLLKNQTILLVDDGIATGATLHASILYLRKQNVRSIVIAAPVAAEESLANFEKEVDRVVCLLAPPAFVSVSQFYVEFLAVSDEEVCSALKFASPKGS